MRKILKVSQNYYINGGSDRYYFDLMNLLEKHGNFVLPFSAKDDKNIIDERDTSFFPECIDVSAPNIKKMHLYHYNHHAKNCLKSALKTYDIELAHLNIYYGRITSSILSTLKEAKIPIVQSLHEYKAICPVYTSYHNGQTCNKCSVNSYLPLLVNKCKNGSLLQSVNCYTESKISNFFGSFDLVDKFICVSKFQMMEHISRGVPKEKVDYLHNFSNIEGVSAINTSFNEKTILYYGRLEEVKGLKTLLNAFVNIIVTEKIRLKIIGNGKMFEELCKFAKPFNESNSLKSIDVIPHLNGVSLRDEIKSAFCIVCPSIWNETFGLTIIEAMALGVPAIASRIGGMSELIDDKKNGLYFEPGDVEELSLHLSTLLNDVPKRNEYAENALIKFSQMYTPDIYYQKLSNIYESVS